MEILPAYNLILTSLFLCYYCYIYITVYIYIYVCFKPVVPGAIRKDYRGTATALWEGGTLCSPWYRDLYQLMNCFSQHWFELKSRRWDQRKLRRHKAALLPEIQVFFSIKHSPDFYRLSVGFQSSKKSLLTVLPVSPLSLLSKELFLEFLVLSPFLTPRSQLLTAWIFLYCASP